MQRIVIPPLFEQGLVLVEKIDDYVDAFYRALNGCLELGSIKPGTLFPASAFRDGRMGYFLSGGGVLTGDFNPGLAFDVAFARAGAAYQIHALAASFEPLSWGQIGAPVLFTVKDSGGTTLGTVSIPNDGLGYSAAATLSPAVNTTSSPLSVVVTGLTAAMASSTRLVALVTEAPISWP